jgi:heme exporter protein CcmD
VSPSGVIAGGWEYVWAAYGLSAAILLGYAVSIYVRYRGERARQKRLPSNT